MLAIHRNSSFKSSSPNQSKADQPIAGLSLIDLNSPFVRSTIVDIEPAAGCLDPRILANYNQLANSRRLSSSLRSEPHLCTFKGNKQQASSGTSTSKVPIGRHSLESLDSRCSSSSYIESPDQCNIKESTSNYDAMEPEYCNNRTHGGGCLLDSANIQLGSIGSLHQNQSQPLDAGRLLLSRRFDDNSLKHVAGSGSISKTGSDSLARLSDLDTSGGRKQPATRTSQQQQQAAKPPIRFLGILASLLGSVMFGMSLACVKLMPDGSIQGRSMAMAIRGILMMVFSSITIVFQGSTFLVRRDELLVNFLRCLFGTVGIFMTYCSFKYLSLGDTTALVFSSPIWTSILSWLILNEPLQWLHLVAMPLCFVGIILIAHPTLIGVDPEVSPFEPILGPEWTLSHQHRQQTDHHISLAGAAATAIGAPEAAINGTLELANDVGSSDDRWIGVIVALGASLVVSATYIVLKFRKKTPIQTTVFWFGITMSLSSIALMSFIGFGQLPISFYDYCLLIGNGLCSWFGQVLLQFAFLHERANVLSIVRTADVATCFIMSAIFLDDEIYWTSVLGAIIIGLVVASIMAGNTLVESFQRRRAHELARYQEERFMESMVSKSNPKAEKMDVKA